MRPLERYFDRYGRFVARHPTPFIVIPTLVTLLSCLGLFRFHSYDDIWEVYTPLDARSRIEERALVPFEFASGSHHYRMQVLVERRDEGDLFNEPDLEEIARVNRHVAENMSLRLEGGSARNYSYRELCGAYCEQSNAAVLAFLQAVLDSGDRRLVYPNSLALNQDVFLGYSIGRLIWEHENDTEALTTGGGSNRSASKVRGFRLFVLHYMVDVSRDRGVELATALDTQLRALCSRLSSSSSASPKNSGQDERQLQFSLLSRARELEEQRRIALTALPYLAVTAVLLLAFMLVTLVQLPLHRSQHWEAVMAVVGPCMALCTTAGLLWAFDVPFSNILTVIPFLCVTIGIDDAFLLLAGWRQSNIRASYESRMGTATAVAGASVTVTSATDVLCFGTGLFSNLPVVRLFCLYATVALAIDYIYQMTVFLGVMAVVCRRQCDAERQYSDQKVPPSPMSGVSSKSSSSTAAAAAELPKRRWRVGHKLAEFVAKAWQSKQAAASTQQCGGATEIAVDAAVIVANQSNVATAAALPRRRRRSGVQRFVDALSHPVSMVVVLAVLALHLVASIRICFDVNTDFSMDKLYLADSPLTNISRRMQDMVLHESFVVNFAVRPAPALDDPDVRAQFEQLVERLERIEGFSRPPPVATNIWTRSFQRAVSFWGDEADFWEKDSLLENYAEYVAQPKYIVVRNESGVPRLDGFYFSIAYFNLTSYLDVGRLLDERRAIIAQFPQFSVSSHHPLDKVPTESARATPYNFVQTAAWAVLLMSLLVLVFVGSLEALLVTVLSICSISVGIIAGLHLWDVRLDAVSLISILMSIGFSVDYSAHVCYHYYAHADHQASSRARLVSALEGVGWPVLQSGLSTMAGMIPLLMVHAYVVEVFWKTVVLVGVLGIAHALVLLPVLFVLLHALRRPGCARRRTRGTYSPSASSSASHQAKY